MPDVRPASVAYFVPGVCDPAAAGDVVPPRLAVLIPCLDEEPTVATVVRAFRAALPGADVWVCDNGSRDRSAAAARAAGAHVVRETRRGKGHALRALLDAADADVYVVVDGDDTYPADAAFSLVAPVLNGTAEMVIGSRLHPDAVSDFTRLHRWGNRFFATLVHTGLGVPVTDLLSGYRALHRRVVRDVALTSDGFAVETELTVKAARAGLRIAEVPVDLRRRPPGSHAKLSVVRDGLVILRTLASFWWRATAPITPGGRRVQDEEAHPAGRVAAWRHAPPDGTSPRPTTAARSSGEPALPAR